MVLAQPSILLASPPLLLLAITSAQCLYFLPTWIQYLPHDRSPRTAIHKYPCFVAPSPFQHFSAQTSHLVCTELSISNIHFSMFINSNTFFIQRNRIISSCNFLKRIFYLSPQSKSFFLCILGNNINVSTF